MPELQVTGRAVISMKEWISGALQEPASSKQYVSGSVISDAYLGCAFKIALSLAGQLCSEIEPRLWDEKQQHGVFAGQDDQADSTPPLSDPSQEDWSDHVAVHLMSSSASPEAGLDFIKAGQATPASISAAEALPADLPDKEDQTLFPVSITSSSYFLNVARAKISLPASSRLHLSSEQSCIYSLGHVFYELFSGGKTPSELVARPPDDDKIDLTDILKVFEEALDDESSQDTQNKNLKKKPRSIPSSLSRTRTKMIQISVERLKMIGLPISLCDLIVNMLESCKGDLGSNEAYNNVSDIQMDLKLMMDNPSKYLLDYDLGSLNIESLPLNDVVYGRQSEFSKLVSSYTRSISGKSELAIISGSSGTGKTVMAQRLVVFAAMNNGIFLKGKFDHYQSKPFSALSVAFNEYCDVLIKQNNTMHIQLISKKLKQVLGMNAYYLLQVIPGLRGILGEDYGVKDIALSRGDGECVDAQKRLQYLLCQFVSIISSSSEVPITIFFDDLQWADPASIGVINQLLLSSGSAKQNEQFFFLGCCREDEMAEDHPIWRMISHVCRFGVNATFIKLTCMDKETINFILSDLLQLSPRLTRTLAHIIYNKTKGNPLFFSQLIRALNKEGSLYFSFTRRRWDWDLDKIQCRKLPENVASFFASTIQNLPPQVQSALFVLSCFGSSTDCELLEILERKIELPLLEPLRVAESEGLVINENGRCRFSHDRVQEAAYSIVPDDERSLRHCNQGLALCTYSIENGNDDKYLFSAVGQVNLGGSSVLTNKDRRITMAKLNLKAGNKAIELSDFSSAFWFFHHGTSLLQNEKQQQQHHWQEEYKLSLSLYEGAAKCTFVNGDFAGLKLYSEQVLTFAKTYQDKLNILYLTMCSLSFSSRLPQSVEKGISILSQLGVSLPKDPSEEEIKRHVEETKLMISCLTDENIMSYKLMTEASDLMAMKFLSKLETLLFMIKPALQPFVTLRMVQLSLTKGMSPLSSLGFAQFGSLLAAIGNIKEGYNFVKIAKNLHDKMGSKEISGKIITLATQVMCFVEPLQSTNELHYQGFIAAMDAGDMSTAIFNKIFSLGGLFRGGTNLSVVKSSFASIRRLMEQKKHLTLLTYLLQLGRTIFMLIGPSEEDGTAEPCEDDIACRESLKEHDLVKKNKHQLMNFYFRKMYISFIFRNYEETKEFADKYFDNYVNNWSLVHHLSEYAFFGGLVSFWIHRKSNETQWAERGREAKFTLQRWAESSQWNFQNKFYLLQAEEHFCNNNIEEAKLYFDNAIAFSRKHKFVNDEALANELAGYFVLGNGQDELPLDYFTRACDKYHEWGAFAKANKLFEFMKESIIPLQTESNISSVIVPSPCVLHSSSCNSHDHNNGHDYRKRELPLL